ncbi:MAG TPA: glycosyltransferase [Spirochaetia bacterium]|nr:glycosyltransferase [Spirochaetia bacterium]
MTRGKLSVCLIAKNESVNIERCLNSVRECADEIVLVDTGSSDDTPEIVESMGARVIHTRWTGDFSVARNLSLEAATGDWILFLDCDEELSPESRQELQGVLDNDNYEAYFVIVDNITDKGHELSVPSIRLFRNRPCFRFKGKIHEQIVNSILANYGQTSLGQSDIVVLHHGYHPHTTNIRAKMNRNLEILLTYGEEEKDGFFYYNLGTEYWRLGQREQALENYSQALQLSNPAHNFGPILVRRTISLLMELNRYRSAIERAKHYQTLLPDYHDLVFLEGACHLACGRYSRAGALFKRYLKMPPPPRGYPKEQGFHGFSPETMQTWAADQARKGAVPNLAVCIAGGGTKEMLARCIRSVQEIARELIFLDPGSPPGCGDVAYQMGATVAALKPGQSQDAVWAEAAATATTKWVLVLYSDEVLAPGGREGVSRIINNPEHQGYLLKLRTFLGPDMSQASCHLKGEMRLFRRSGNRPPPPGHAGIVIDCLRYTSAGKEPAQAGMSAYDHALTCFYRQDFHAAVAGLAMVSRENAPGPAFFFFYGLSLINSGNTSEALAVLEEGVAGYGDYTDLRYLRGIARFQLGDATAAERDFARCLEMGDAPWFKYTVSPGTGTHRSLCSLGTILAERGDTPGALDLFLRAAKVADGFEPALERLAFLVDQWPQAPMAYLESRGLLNSVSLGILAGTLAGKGRYRESLEYLSTAGERLAQEPVPRSVGAWVRAMDHLLANLNREAGTAF